MLRILLFSIVAIVSTSLTANNLQITNITHSGNDITFDVSWENSWRTGLTFHDAIWIFVKEAPNGNQNWMHANVASATVGAGFETVVPTDNLGIFLRRDSDGNGTATTSITLTMVGLNGAFQDLKVMGTEMVYIPQGTFKLGDGSSQNTFTKGNDPLDSYTVSNEDAMTYGSGWDDFSGGGLTVDIPATFPKGYSSFYIMKYHITQDQYVQFLNCLTRVAQDTRTTTDLSGTTITNTFVMVLNPTPRWGNGIRCDASIGTGTINFYCDFDGDGIGNEPSDGLSKICNAMSVNDTYAYMDWSGLGPMTVLEYEKACRGPLSAIQNEYAWGSTLQNAYTTLLNEGFENEVFDNPVGGMVDFNSVATRVGLMATSTTTTREMANASYYGVLDLTHGLTNLCIDPKQTDYEGEEGDGILNIVGEANFFPFTIIPYSKAFTSTVSRNFGTYTVPTSNNRYYAGRALKRL